MQSVKNFADAVKIVRAQQRRRDLRRYGANIGAGVLGALALYAASLKHRNK